MLNILGDELTGVPVPCRKKYRIVYRLIDERLEVIEIIGIGKREKEEIYKLIYKRMNGCNSTPL